MFNNIQTYLNAIARSWQMQDGKLMAALVSLRDRHATNVNLQAEHPDHMVERVLDAPMDEIYAEHIKVLFYLSRTRKFSPFF